MEKKKTAADLYLMEGRRLLIEGDSEGAAEMLRKAAELQPEDAETQFYLLGIAYFESETKLRLERAAGRNDAFRNMFSAGPARWRMHVGLAITYLSYNSTAEALDHLKSACEERPAEAFIHHYLGLLYVGRGDVELALAALERALIIEPDYAAARSLLESLRSGQGRDFTPAREASG